MNRLRWVMIGVMVAMILGTALSSPVQAREPGRQDIGYIISYQSEIIFPAAISFSVEVLVPQAEIVSAALSVYQHGDVLSTIELDLNEHVLRSTETYTQMVYQWSLTSADAPIPFEPISYRWEIMTQDEEVSIVADDLLFEDERRGFWRTAGRPPLVLRWTDAGMAGELMRDDLLPVYDLLQQNTGRALDFQFALYEPDTSYCQEITDEETEEVRLVVVSGLDATEFPCSMAAFEDFYADAGVIFVERPNAGFTPSLAALTQHMVRLAYAPLWEDTFVPAWFQTGLEFVYRQHPAPEMLSAARNAAQLEDLLSIEELSVMPPESATFQQQELWDAQSYLLVLYLIDRFGPDVVFNLARTAGDGDFEGALFTLVGGDDRVLWENWNLWMQYEDAEAAVTWTPYGN